MGPDELYIEDLRLRNKQRYVNRNRMFEEEGLTDRVLREQLEINKRRNELDIHDPNEELDDEKFVQ